MLMMFTILSQDSKEVAIHEIIINKHRDRSDCVVTNMPRGLRLMSYLDTPGGLSQAGDALVIMLKPSIFDIGAKCGIPLVVDAITNRGTVTFNLH